MQDEGQSAKAVQVGKVALQAGDFAKALKFFAKAVQLDPNNKEARTLFAATQKKATSSKPSSASASASASAPTSSGRADESEVVVVKRIMTARNFYEMLGVARGCSESELKKAYRKTSLKVHPDKNKAPGAVEAFQKVAEAFDVLSDERKKEIYDSVGHDQYSERSRTGGAGGPAENPFAGFNGRPFGAGGVNHISVEELFNMFMSQRGGMGEFQFNGQRQRMNRQRANDDDRRHYQEAAVNRPASWMSFLPILFVVLVWLGGSLFSSTPAFSLVQTHTHPVMRQTMSVERLEYFVERDFGKRFPTPADVIRMERDVRAEWLRALDHNCAYEKREKASKLYWAYGARRKDIEAIPMPNCERLVRVKQDRVVE